jgi:hypothetical protein
MHFTVERATLVKLMEGLSAPKGRPKEDPVRLWANGARLCVEINGNVAGTEALVFRSGHCRTDRKRFLQLLKSYYPKKNLTFELVGCGLRFGSSTLEVTEAATVDEPPPHFAVVPAHGMSAGRSR